MAYSYVRLAGDGSTSLFTFSFPYFDRSNISVRVGGIPSTFTWVSDASIRILPAPTGTVEIRRTTPKDEVPVNFSDGSVLKEADLDLLAVFSLYCAQESQDIAEETANLSDTAEALAKVYQGALEVAPGIRLDGSRLVVGDLYYDTLLNTLRVYTGLLWQNAGATVPGVLKKPLTPLVATAGQVSVTVPGGYDPAGILVFVNGVLLPSDDITVTSGTNIVFLTPLTSGDEITWIAFGIFSVADLSAFVSVGLATVQDLMALTPRSRTTVHVDEYATGYGPEGGGWFKWADNSTAPHDGFMVFTPTSNPSIGRWKRTAYTEINVKMAGCKGDGSIDDTPRLQAASDYFVASGGQVGNLVIPAGGIYAIQEWVIADSMFKFSIENKGSYLEARSIVPRESMLRIVNSVDIDFTGKWRFNGANNANYKSALAFRVKAGTSQSTTRINFYNPTFRNCRIGISNGENGVDFQCSEINIFGANFFQTPCCVYNGGSNTGLQLNGCNITSEPNAAFPDVYECAIWQEGGFWKISGGSMVTNPSADCAIMANPCYSTLYGPLYGTGDVTGAHCEINGRLLAVTNPLGIAAPSSAISSFKFVNNTGYAGGDVSEDFNYIQDSTYAGKVIFSDNNWYSSVLRTGWNISGLSPVAQIVMDKTSFGANFKNWLGGINAGHVIHDDVPVLSCTGLSATYPLAVGTNLKFQARTTTDELARYQTIYNSSTGEITVPPGGFSRLQIRSSFVASGATSADVSITRNGAVVAYGAYTNGSGSVATTLHNLVGGDVIAVVFKPYGAAVTVADLGPYNYLQVSGETRAH